jgi:hypothetical protein
MQDRYVGDIGDYFKYSLLREVHQSRSRLGVAWYLHPDEGHNNDGKHVDYLRHPLEWRHLDPEVFDTLRTLVESKKRNVVEIENADILPNVTFSSDRLQSFSASFNERSRWRKEWFSNVEFELSECDAIFVDPDNGIRSSDNFRYGTKRHWKSVPVHEISKLANGRLCVVYHHNTRYPGGHAKEIQHWLSELEGASCALQWRAYSSRTFFVLNAKEDELERMNSFSDRWGDKCEIITTISR